MLLLSVCTVQPSRPRTKQFSKNHASTLWLYDHAMKGGGRPSKNTLPPGTSRLGFVVDGDANSPQMATLLENDGGRIRLSIPWNQYVGEEYRRWFLRANFGDDPDRTRYRYDVPDCLVFHDNQGSVSLVGCRWQGAGEEIVTKLGVGRISVDYAVFGGRIGSNYRRLNGLRSELVGLGDWMGLRSLSEKIEFDESRLIAANLRLEAPSPVRLSRRMNLTVAPAFSINRSVPDTTALRERMYIQTTMKRPQAWSDHLMLHQAVRDLVSLSAWRDSHFTGHNALREDDPRRTLSGHAVASRWSPVETYMTQIPSSDDDLSKSTRREPLFTFQDVGTSGIAAWIRLRLHMRRGIDPILSSLYNDQTVLSRLAAVGIGFEALAYQIAIDASVSKSVAGRENHRSRLVRVGNEVKLPLPFTVDDWATRATDAYNGIKHADRPEVDMLDAINAWRESVLVFRLWVATRLRATGSAVRKTAAGDRMREPYVRT